MQRQPRDSDIIAVESVLPKNDRRALLRGHRLHEGLQPFCNGQAADRERRLIL